MTYGKYLTNACLNNINVNKASEKLIEEWEKRNITYPRTNGIVHKPIEIINKNNINKEVERLLEFKHLEYKKITKDTIYYISEQLYLSTPSALIVNIKRAKEIKKRKYDKLFLEEKIFLFKKDLSKDKYISIKEANLNNILKLKNRKLKKNRFNKELDKLR